MSLKDDWVQKNTPGYVEADWTFTAAAANAVAAAVNTLAAFNVQTAYNAAGDGITDDTAEIQAAIDAAETDGGIVFFPPGTYLVTGLTVPSAVTIAGAGVGASIIEKTGTGILLDVSGSATGSENHTSTIEVRNITLNGGATTGTLLRAYYSSILVCDNVFFTNTLGKCVDAAELWDSRFTGCIFDTQSTTLPAVHLRSSAATSPNFGYSADNTNNIRFNHCRWEIFKYGALHIEGGPEFTSLVHSVFVTNSKMETGAVRGKPVVVNGDTECVHIDKLFLWGSGFDSGFSTPQTAIYFTPSQHGSLRDIYIGCSATQVWNLGMELFTVTGPLVVDNVMYRGGANPAGSVVWFAVNSAPIEFGSIASSTDLLFAGSPNVVGPRPLKSVAATSASALTPDLGTTRQYSYTALAETLTINAPLAWGLCIVDGQELIFRFKDNGSGQTINWNAAYRAVGVTLPTVTTSNKTLYVRGRYNVDAAKVDMIDVKQEA